MIKVIMREELVEKMELQSEVTIIEALPEKYYDDGHLPGAVQINHDELLEKQSLLPEGKEDVIVVYCSNIHCGNSHKLALILSELGYKNVYKYSGGKQDWAEAGLSFSKGGK